MIKINLLPVRASKKRDLGRQWLVLFALVFLASIVGNYFWYAKKEETLATVRARTQKYRDDNAVLQKIIGEVNDIKKQRADIEQKLKTLKEMRARKIGPVRVLDELTNVLPQRIWLESIEQAGETLTFTGSGMNLDEVATFMRKLKGPPVVKDQKDQGPPRLFSNPVLRNSRQAGENKVDFVITCSFKYS